MVFSNLRTDCSNEWKQKSSFFLSTSSFGRLISFYQFKPSFPEKYPFTWNSAAAHNTEFKWTSDRIACNIERTAQRIKHSVCTSKKKESFFLFQCGRVYCALCVPLLLLFLLLLFISLHFFLCALFAHTWFQQIDRFLSSFAIVRFVYGYLFAYLHLWFNYEF